MRNQLNRTQIEINSHRTLINEYKENEVSYKHQLMKVTSLLNTIAINLEEERKWREGSGDEEAHAAVKRILEKIRE